jgi:hypothetical protein
MLAFPVSDLSDAASGGGSLLLQIQVALVPLCQGYKAQTMILPECAQ